jgi:hypothetical protein
MAPFERFSDVHRLVVLGFVVFLSLALGSPATPSRSPAPVVTPPARSAP